MMLVVILVLLLLFSETEPYWNSTRNSNKIAKFEPWFYVNSKIVIFEIFLAHASEVFHVIGFWLLLFLFDELRIA